MNSTKRSCTLLGQDFRNSIRNNIILYMLGFIIAASLVSRLFVASLEGMEIHYAVDSEVGSEIGSRLMEYGTVEVYSTREAVMERVLKYDDVPGIIKDGNHYSVILEGNEGDAVLELPGVVLEQIARGGTGFPVNYISLGVRENVAKPITAILLVISAVLISGISMGLLIVEDKESRMNSALAVTPMRGRDYIAGRSLLAAFLAFAMSLISISIMLGTGIDYAKIVAGITASTGMALVFGFIIGGFAENLLGAIAILKSLMFVFLGIPIAAIFVPPAWQWTMYVFPNYWSYRTFYAVLVEHSGWPQVLQYGMLIIGTTMALSMALSRKLRKRLRLR